MPESVSVERANAPVLLSPRATEEVKKIMESKSIPEGFGLRVGVRGGGCSGMSYILGFDKMRDQDLEFEIDDIVLFIDKRHGLYLFGTTIDYQDGLKCKRIYF